VNPGPRIDKLSVALGDSFDHVRAAYPTAGDSGSGELNMPLDGIRLFFTKEDKVLQEIMLEAPFTGSINGVRLGDSASDVVARLGQPYAIAPVFGGSGYLYRIGGNIVRYDTDKSNKVNALVQILDRKLDAKPFSLRRGSKSYARIALRPKAPSGVALARPPRRSPLAAR
jgi:hypothetical protein